MNIDLGDLTVDLGDTRVLEDISATVNSGEFVGLVGPNGAGKTTVLRTILGAIEPTQGTVRVGSDSVDTLSARERSHRVAAVPQRSDVSFGFTVREVVEMGRYPHRPRFRRADDPTKVAEAMDQTGISHLANRSIDAVSGGERQRVLLARAIAQDTPALLLDEPTASLDVNHQVRTLDLVAELVDNGRTVLAAIHDLNLAARYCDRLVLMSDGTIRTSGVPDAVLTSEAIEDVFDTRAVVRTDPFTGAPLVTAFPDREDTTAGTVHVVGGGHSAANVVAQLVDAGVSVTVGIVPVGDQVLGLVENLEVDAVVAPPFGSPSEDTVQRAVRLSQQADVTVAVPSQTTAAPANQQVLADCSPILAVNGVDGIDSESVRHVEECDVLAGAMTMLQETQSTPSPNPLR